MTQAEADRINNTPAVVAARLEVERLRCEKAEAGDRYEMARCVLVEEIAKAAAA